MTKTNSSDEVDKILDDVYSIGRIDATLDANDYKTLKPNIKKRPQELITKREREAVISELKRTKKLIDGGIVTPNLYLSDRIDVLQEELNDE